MEQRNLIIAITLSVLIVIGFQFLQPRPKPQPAMQQTAASSTSAPGPSTPTGAAGGNAPGVAAPGSTLLSRADALAVSSRIAIDTPRLKGSIALKGARFDDLSLTDYHETVDPKSPAIILLTPTGAARAYLSEQGWISKTPGVATPNQDTLWKAEAGATLTPTTPVTLTWDNGAGLKFTRTISVDRNFVFTVADKVENDGGTPVTLAPYGLISRAGPVPASGTYISYEGPMGGFDNGAEDVKYKDIDPNAPVERQSIGGWLGFSDKYWLTAVAPANQKQAIDARFTQAVNGTALRYQTDWLGADMTVAPKASIASSSYLFAGAKEVKLLDKYATDLKLPHFDKAVDWGWFFFLTKPIFGLLDYIYSLVGNFGVAILILTVLVKAAFFPLANRSYVNIHKMKRLQPEMAKLREKFGDDKARLNQEMMVLYKKVGANPVFGCIPVLLQVPVFFSLYKVLYVTIEMRHAPFFGWIHDLSAPDPTSLFNLFGLIAWTPPQQLMIGVWPIIYCATMFLQQRMQPPMPDPTQAKMFMFMPLIFTVLLAHFPAGLVIYWSWNNTLTVTQQWFITRRLDRAKKPQRVPA
jgi:YidC/Oxa1 family membrane protein insertase